MQFVLTGLVWLARALIGLLPALVTWFSTWMTKRVAIAAVVTTAFVALTTAFYGSISGLISLVSVVSPPYFIEACSLILPSNVTACLSLFLATVSARWLYDVQLKVLNYSNMGAGF